jgi:hypothetical protein
MIPQLIIGPAMKAIVIGLIIGTFLLGPSHAKNRSSVNYGIGCLKPDEDWVDGVTRRECLSVHGRWKRPAR